MLIYLATGCLPWQDLCRDHSAYESTSMLKQKQSADMHAYCQNHGLPAVFADVVTYARRLAFDQKPSYRRIRNAFRASFKAQGYVDDGVFDWTVEKGFKEVQGELDRYVSVIHSVTDYCIFGYVAVSPV